MTKFNYEQKGFRVLLIKPSIEREIRSEMTEYADEKAINIFGVNLENLLMKSYYVFILLSRSTPTNAWFSRQ